MANPEVKAKVKAKLEAVKSDLSAAKIKTRISGIDKIDNKLKADFSVSGLPTEKNDFGYRDITKIFDSWVELSDYAEKFLNMTDQELIELCKK